MNWQSVYDTFIQAQLLRGNNRGGSTIAPSNGMQIWYATNRENAEIQQEIRQINAPNNAYGGNWDALRAMYEEDIHTYYPY
jgi:hypothetical protein